jgi:hypothetical protein
MDGSPIHKDRALRDVIMVSRSDFIGLDYTADLTEAGIAYARKHLSVQPEDYTGSGSHEALRGIVAGVAVELAFRRYLDRQKIPYKNISTAPFTQPERPDIMIGGRRCVVILSTITQKNQIRKLNNHPEALLDAPASVPVEKVLSDQMQDEDLFIFAFLKALIAPNLRSMKQAVRANQPIFLMHKLPAKWTHPDHWSSLGKIEIRCSSHIPTFLTLDGLDSDRNFLSEQVALHRGEEKKLSSDFFALISLYSRVLLERSVEVFSPKLENTHLIAKIRWGNIWVYGLQITLAGFMTGGEFTHRTSEPGAGTLSQKQLSPISGSLSISVSELHPLQGLFTRAKTWKGYAG